MTITLTPKESEEYFYNALCNGLGYISGYGLSIDFDKSQYKVAKEKLTNPCYEDVFMQMLRDGGTLTLVDEECDGEYTRSVTLKDVHERVPKTEMSHLMDMVKENDDATTADVILQTVFYEEIIFG